MGFHLSFKARICLVVKRCFVDGIKVLSVVCTERYHQIDTK